MRQIIQIALLSARQALGTTFVIVTVIGSLFVLVSISYFLLPELANFGSLQPANNAASAGVSVINMFVIFLSIFFTLSALLKQFARDNLIFFLSKPLTCPQLLLGTSLGVVMALLIFWIILSLELIVIMLIFAKGLLFQTILALLPIVLLIAICVSLTTFFFALWPNYICALFPFLVILASLGRNDLKLLFSKTGLAWLSKLIDLSSFFIPRVGEILALSFRSVGAMDVPIRINSLLMHTVFIIVVLYILSIRRISDILERL